MPGNATADSHNACRDLASAFGVPDGAPLISWLELEMGDGTFKAPPFVSPIETIKALLKHDVKLKSNLHGFDVIVLFFGRGSAVMSSTSRLSSL